MNFSTLLENTHSKATTTLIVDEIEANPSKLDELMQLMLGKDLLLAQRAAWPFSFVAEKNPLLFKRYIPQLIQKLENKDDHPAIKRNILRAFQYFNFSAKHEGKLLNISFNLLNDFEQPIAIKAFAMTVIYNLSEKYPEIKNELKLSIENLLPHGSAGIKSRGNKILKQLNK
jgi:hypothetical protein